MIVHPPQRPEFEGVGLTIEPFRGVRAWHTNEHGSLTGITYHYPWTLGENLAGCIRTSAADSDALPAVPDHAIEDCVHGNGHGFYAYWDGSNNYRSIGRVEGVIEGFGRVVVGSRGFRATKARIVALFVPGVYLASRERYELMKTVYWAVPFFDSFEEMIDEFPPDIPEEES